MQEMNLFGASNKKKEEEVVTDPHNLERVKQNEWALPFVKEQTPEICLAGIDAKYCFNSSSLHLLNPSLKESLHHFIIFPVFSIDKILNKSNDIGVIK